MLRSRQEYLMDHFGIDRYEADEVIIEEMESRRNQEDADEEENNEE